MAFAKLTSSPRKRGSKFAVKTYLIRASAGMTICCIDVSSTFVKFHSPTSAHQKAGVEHDRLACYPLRNIRCEIQSQAGDLGWLNHSLQRNGIDNPLPYFRRHQARRHRRSFDDAGRNRIDVDAVRAELAREALRH